MRVSAKIRAIAQRTLIVGAALAIGITGAIGYAAPATTKAASDITVINEKQVDSQTYDILVTSPLFDSWVKTTRLIVPQGWTKNSATKYPALWLLHGGMDGYQSWTDNTDIKQMVSQKQVVVVIPDTSWCSAYSDWFDTKGPRWETYLTGALRNLLNNNYAVRGSDAAVAGLSMGGLGALKLAAHHPDMFNAVASFSGNADPLHAYNNTATGPDLPGLSCATDWKRVWGDYTIPAQRAIWERNDPYVQAANFSNMDYIYLASGDGLSNPLNNNSGILPDQVEQQVNIETQALLGRLQSMNIPADSHFYTGTHSWPYWNQELHSSLPGLLNAIGVQ